MSIYSIIIYLKISNILIAFIIYIGVHLSEIISLCNNIVFTQPLRLSSVSLIALQQEAIYYNSLSILLNQNFQNIYKCYSIS